MDEKRRFGRVALPSAHEWGFTKWLYLPSLGWDRLVRRATQADVEAASGTPVLLKDDPNLVPLETLAGRNHYHFPAAEEPPWRWRIESIHPG